MTPCPICACDLTTTFFKKDGREFNVCFDCRHIFRIGMPDPVAVHAYEDMLLLRRDGAEDIRATHQRQARELASLCNLSIGRMTVANLGAPDAAFAWNAMHAGTAVAFEVTWSREAREDGIGRQIAVLTPEEFDNMIPDGFLDALRYADTLGRLPDPVATLRRQAAKLRVGGLLHVTQPNLPVLMYTLSKIEPHGAVMPMRLHFFSPLSFLRLAEAAGLTVERYYTTTDPEEGETRYADLVDPDHAERMLRPLNGRGEEKHGPLNNYPSYTGFDAVAHLRKPPPPAPPPPDLKTRVRSLWTRSQDPGSPRDIRGDVLGVIGLLSKRSLGIPIG